MSKFKAGILGATTLSLGLFAATSAMAITNFTWNPAGGGISDNATGFTSDNITIKDYAIINIPANPTGIGSISESGVLAITTFNAPSGSLAGFVSGTGNGAAGAVVGATPFQLYITFTSTSHLLPNGTNFSGQFDTLSYSLWGDKGGLCDFAPAGVTGCGSPITNPQIELANGVLSSLGLNQVSINSGIPSANVQLTFNELVPGFFTSPTNVTLEMEGAFTNTPGATDTSAGCTFGVTACTITITAGGGNLDFIPQPVPEPGTLWLLGAGLLGLAGMGRRLRARS